MSKFLKSFLSAFVILYSLSLSASAMNWEDELIQKQTYPKKGDAFPDVKYKAWAKHEVGRELEEKLTTESHRAVFVVVPDTFRPVNSRHLQQFVIAYANEEHPLRKNRTPTYIISGDKPSVMARWAKEMGANSDFLRVIPDHRHTLMTQLGVLEKDNDDSLIGKRSLFYVEDGKIVELTTEQAYDDIIETSPDKAGQFVKRHWQLKDSMVVYVNFHLDDRSPQDIHDIPILKKIDERLLASHNIALVRLHVDFPGKYEPQTPHLVLNVFSTELMFIYPQEIWHHWRHKLNEKFGSNWAYIFLLNPITLGKCGLSVTRRDRPWRSYCDSLAEHPNEHLFAPVIFEWNGGRTSDDPDEEIEKAVTTIAQYVERLK